MAQIILRLSSVEHCTGLSKSQIYQLMAKGRFPKRVSLGGRAVGWPQDEVQDWIEEQIAESRKADAGRG